MHEFTLTSYSQPCSLGALLRARLLQSRTRPAEKRENREMRRLQKQDDAYSGTGLVQGNMRCQLSQELLRALEGAADTFAPACKMSIVVSRVSSHLTVQISTDLLFLAALNGSVPLILILRDDEWVWSLCKPMVRTRHDPGFHFLMYQLFKGTK